MVAPSPIAELVQDAGQLPDGVAITFHLEGDGGGVWTLVSDRGRLDLRFGDIGWADCRFACSVDDFMAWCKGHLDPIQAHIERRVRLEGDVGLILRIRERASEPIER